MKVLVVEDDRVMRVAIEKSLSSKGYEVMTANDGIEALSLIQCSDPDVIVSDIKMPGISGLELFNVLRQFDLKKTPLILISSMKKKSVLEKFKDLGNQCYMEKPVDLDKLHRRIQIMLHLKMR